MGRWTGDHMAIWLAWAQETFSMFLIRSWGFYICFFFDILAVVTIFHINNNMQIWKYGFYNFKTSNFSFWLPNFENNNNNKASFAFSFNENQTGFLIVHRVIWGAFDQKKKYIWGAKEQDMNDVVGSLFHPNITSLRIWFRHLVILLPCNNQFISGRMLGLKFHLIERKTNANLGDFGTRFGDRILGQYLDSRSPSSDEVVSYYNEGHGTLSELNWISAMLVTRRPGAATSSSVWQIGCHISKI